MPRGGYRRPTDPAPVSGPGALSQRTDGGPQPMRVAGGGDYGDRQAMEQQQGGAQMASAPGTPEAQAAQGAPQGGAQGPVSTQVRTDIFGPTDRPDEPGTAGVPIGAGDDGDVLPDDPTMMVRALYAKFPSQGLLDVIDRLERKAGGR